MLPEQKLAQRFAAHHKLRPPVDIHKLVAKLADVEEVDLPIDADAVFIGKGPNRAKPLILLHRNKPSKRKVFTLAHEVGHIVIPWHTGTFVCNVNYNATVSAEVFRDLEMEANRFASELLLPAAWLKRLHKSQRRLVKIFDKLSATGLSPAAISYGLFRALPPGYFFIEADGNTVESFSRSPETNIVGLKKGDALQLEAFTDLVDDYHCLSGRTDFHWFRLKKRVKAPKSGKSRKKSTSIIKDIIAAVEPDAIKAKQLLFSVNGVIGFANNLPAGSDLYTILKRRFANRPNLQKLLDHPSFDIFLKKKSSELEKKWNKAK